MTWLRKKVIQSVLLMLILACSGCAEITSSLIAQGSVQYAGEKYLISQSKPFTRCSMYNVIQGNKMCRIYRQYRRA